METRAYFREIVRLQRIATPEAGSLGIYTLHPHSMTVILNWLSEHSTAITALAGMITAMATIAIAVLTGGTIALYRLERAKLRASKSRLAAQLWRLQNHFLTAADMISEIEQEDPLLTGAGKEVIRFIATENALRARQIEAMLDYAGSVKMEIVARLDAALLMLRASEGITDHILSFQGGHADLVEPRNTLKKELLVTSILLREAYEQLPQANRAWEGGKEPYDQVLGKVLERYRERQRV